MRPDSHDIAIVGMAIYHFCFDLRYFGVTRSDFEHDPFWLAARSAILSSFLLIAGISMVLARQNARFAICGSCSAIWRACPE